MYFISENGGILLYVFTNCIFTANIYERSVFEAEVQELAGRKSYQNIENVNAMTDGSANIGHYFL